MKLTQGREPNQDGHYIAYIDNCGTSPDINLLQFTQGKWWYKQSFRLPYQAHELVVAYLGPIPLPRASDLPKMVQMDRTELKGENMKLSRKDRMKDLKVGDVFEATYRSDSSDTVIKGTWEVVSHPIGRTQLAERLNTSRKYRYEVSLMEIH